MDADYPLNGVLIPRRFTILDEMVNAPSLDDFKSMTGEDFVRGAIQDLKNYKLPEIALADYLLSYEGERFLQSASFVRHYPEQLPKLAAYLSRIDIPCQIIVGRSDPYVPVSNAEGVHRGLMKSKLYVLECGHFAWEDEAFEYGRLALEWIKSGHLAF